MPLPTWLFLLALPLLAFIFPRPTTFAQPPPSLRWLRIFATSLYFSAIGVVLLLQSVEVARLVRASLGVGLTPFVYAGCLIAALLRATDRHFLSSRRLPVWWWQGGALLFWLAGAVVSVLKAVALSALARQGPVLARVGTAYPMVDQIVDVAILAGFYGLLLTLEAVLLALFVHSSGRRRDRDTLTDLDGSKFDLAMNRRQMTETTKEPHPI